MMKNIKHIIYTTDIAGALIMKDFECEKIPVIDARSAVYVATGIAAQNKEIVMVLVNSSNASRSAFSGMTEAYYRKLPIVLVTVGMELDYSKELNDVINSHFVISDTSKIDGLLESEMPMHIEIRTERINIGQKKSVLFDLLKKVLGSHDYLYVGQSISIDKEGFKCKVVHGGTPDCLEGSLANVLGASLAKIRKRYIGVVTEDEFIHDMNTLGNINVNDSLLYIVLCGVESSLIFGYANSLGFECYKYEVCNISQESFTQVINSNRKSLVVVCGD